MSWDFESFLDGADPEASRTWHLPGGHLEQRLLGRRRVSAFRASHVLATRAVHPCSRLCLVLPESASQFPQLSRLPMSAASLLSV